MDSVVRNRKRHCVVMYCAMCGKPLGNMSLEEHYRLECDKPIIASQQQRVEALEEKVKRLEREVMKLMQEE